MREALSVPDGCDSCVPPVYQESVQESSASCVSFKRVMFYHVRPQTRVSPGVSALERFKRVAEHYSVCRQPT
jgi:hypothetical protein